MHPHSNRFRDLILLARFTAIATSSRPERRKTRGGEAKWKQLIKALKAARGKEWSRWRSQSSSIRIRCLRRTTHTQTRARACSERKKMPGLLDWASSSPCQSATMTEGERKPAGSRPTPHTLYMGKEKLPKKCFILVLKKTSLFDNSISCCERARKRNIGRSRHMAQCQEKEHDDWALWIYENTEMMAMPEYHLLAEHLQSKFLS